MLMPERMAVPAAAQGTAQESVPAQAARGILQSVLRSLPAPAVDRGARPALSVIVPVRDEAASVPVLVDELLLAREDIVFNAGSDSVSIIMRAADFARLSGARACRFAQAVSPGG